MTCLRMDSWRSDEARLVVVPAEGPPAGQCQGGTASPEPVVRNDLLADGFLADLEDVDHRVLALLGVLPLQHLLHGEPVHLALVNMPHRRHTPKAKLLHDPE